MRPSERERLRPREPGVEGTALLSGTYGKKGNGAPMTGTSHEERAFRAAFDADYVERFARRLSAIGAFELGFRPSGTEAGWRAGQVIADEMRRIGLRNVRREPFPVYAWDFAGASLELDGWEPVDASSFPPAARSGST